MSSLPRLVLAATLLLSGACAHARQPPRLVVAIVVDQMRYDYLERFQDKFVAGGFKRLLTDGFDCRNTHYDYIPTHTAPGHASIHTGSTPAIHGIAANFWYDRASDDWVYSVADETENTVGSSSAAGRASPRNLLATTISDQLRIATRHRAKVIGIALKDRASILSAGRMANAAYWLDVTTGTFITSSYYRKQLPQWLQRFNERDLASAYLRQGWHTLLPLEQYIESAADDQSYERSAVDGQPPRFPYPPAPKDADAARLLVTPFGNTLTKDLALAALRNEALGKDDVTDFLALSFTSTDYIGHAYGTYAVETQDAYLRLDRDLAELLDALQSGVGKEHLLVFLTSDHGAADAAGFARAEGAPGGVVEAAVVLEELPRRLERTLGEGRWILRAANDQLYINRPLIAERGVSRRKLLQAVRAILVESVGVLDVIDMEDTGSTAVPTRIVEMARRGHHAVRSGDLRILMRPGWYIATGDQGTQHGSAHPHDTHVPLLWYGGAIAPGGTSRRISITDIAPTLAQLLGVLEPSGSIGEPVRELFRAPQKAP